MIVLLVVLTVLVAALDASARVDLLENEEDEHPILVRFVITIFIKISRRSDGNSRTYIRGRLPPPLLLRHIMRTPSTTSDNSTRSKRSMVDMTTSLPRTEDEARIRIAPSVTYMVTE